MYLKKTLEPLNLSFYFLVKLELESCFYLHIFHSDLNSIRLLKKLAKNEKSRDQLSRL